jgi:hypothetical protein
MTSKILLLGLFLIFIPLVLAETAEECAPIGCFYESNCSTFGEVLNLSGASSYCDFNGSFITQKAINSFCSNDYECLSGSCLSEKCINLSLVLDDYASLYQNLTNFSAGPCNVNPGCFNKTNFTNAHSLVNLCSAPKLGYTCFECNEDYEWNGSSCNLLNCTSNPGCLNVSTFENAYSLNRNCSLGNTCFRCKSGYIWNSNSSRCEYIITDSSGSSFWISTTVLSNSQILDGYEDYLKEGWRWKIYFDGYYYLIGLRNISSGSAIIEVSSRAPYVSLKPGENKEFDLNTDGEYDVNLYLKSISGDKANFLLIFSEKTPINSNKPLTSGNSENPGDSSNPTLTISNVGDNNTLFWIIVILLIVLSIAVIIAIALFVHRNSANQEKNQGNKRYLD